MAQVHNELRRGPWSRALKLFLGDTRAESGIERYGETLTPTLDLWNRQLGEIPLLRQEITFSQMLVQNAVAAEFSLIGLGLPVASKDILIVEGASFRQGAAGPSNLGFLTRATVAATCSVSGVANNRDQRAANAGFVILSLGNRIESWAGTDTGVLIPNANALEEGVVSAANTPGDFKSGPWVIKPGGTLMAQGGAVNQLLAVSMWGRVRAALPGELINTPGA